MIFWGGKSCPHPPASRLSHTEDILMAQLLTDSLGSPPIRCFPGTGSNLGGRGVSGSPAYSLASDSLVLPPVWTSHLLLSASSLSSPRTCVPLLLGTSALWPGNLGMGPSSGGARSSVDLLAAGLPSPQGFATVWSSCFSGGQKRRGQLRSPCEGRGRSRLGIKEQCFNPVLPLPLPQGTGSRRGFGVRVPGRV